MPNSLEEFVESLNLDLDFKFSNGSFVAVLPSSNSFSKVYNKVSLNDNLEVVDKQTVTESSTSFTYTDGYYEVRLIANYDEDVYKVICEER